jgi:hypothetical protein
VGVEVVRDAGVFLCCWTQVRRLFEAALDREGGDVFVTRLGPGFLCKRRVGWVFLNVHRGRGGARTGPSATLALAGTPSRPLSRVGLLCDRPHRSGPTVFRSSGLSSFPPKEEPHGYSLPPGRRRRCNVNRAEECAVVGDGHVRPRKRDRRDVMDSDMRVLSLSVAARLGLHIAGERGIGGWSLAAANGCQRARAKKQLRIR